MSSVENTVTRTNEFEFRRNEVIDAIKAIAILLVTNSHMREYYPSPAFATGGLLGNCLFFFSAGFLVSHSSSGAPAAFISWYYNKLLRIYPTLWLGVCILVFFSYEGPFTGFNIFLLIFAPADFWFIPAIAVIYPISYFAAKVKSNTATFYCIAAATLIYIYTYLTIVDYDSWSVENSPLSKTPFYVVVMLSGLIFGRRKANFQFIAIRPAFYLISATILFFGYLALMKTTGFYALQFLSQLLALAWTCAMYGFLCEFYKRHSTPVALRKIVSFLSRHTLEIYCCQVVALNLMNSIQHNFPEAAILFILIVILSAKITFLASSYIYGRLKL